MRQVTVVGVNNVMFCFLDDDIKPDAHVGSLPINQMTHANVRLHSRMILFTHQ